MGYRIKYQAARNILLAAFNVARPDARKQDTVEFIDELVKIEADKICKARRRALWNKFKFLFGMED